ncbi:6,7-dimethyl-8-ribityllumazine synthase 1 [mine drainage metagenome]|uniref:6,7-dimethyl-8-ribityllumazine synthase n=1 Tax=mine drainage metagenome TaxID=410659 RepID=A0A1J5RMB4_9ZZZZ
MNGMRVLIVESRFYEEITDGLVKGAVKELSAQGVGYKRLIVPGILEIPAAVRYAVRAMELRATDERYAGYIALGCAIRGETDHYEHVCRLAMDGLQTLTLDFSLAVGNGILTVHNRPQAMERCLPERRNFGGQAARACLRMIDIKRELSLIPK